MPCPFDCAVAMSHVPRPLLQDSGEVCDQLGFCNQTATVQVVKAKPRPQVAVGDTLCDLCQLAVSFLKPYVDSNTTEVGSHVTVM